MKDLTKYLSEPHYTLPTFGWDFDKWCMDNNITDPTTEDIDWYMAHSWTHEHKPAAHMKLWGPISVDDINPLQRLTEMLRAVPLKVLAKHMQREYGAKYKQQIIAYPKDCGDVIDSVEVNIPTKLYKDDDAFDEFCKQLETMAWYFSHSIKSKLNLGVTTIIIEPINANDVTDYVMKKCGGIIYHICRANHTPLIFKTGLRPKGKDTPIDFSSHSNNTAPTYRSFPNRIHFVCGESYGDVMEKVACIIDDKCSPREKKLPSDQKWALFNVLKIDLNKHSCDIRFYADGMYIGRGFIYTMAYFPPKFIEIER